MGDRSPKSVQKKASQKQLKADEVTNRKQQAITAQQATKLNLAGRKK